LNGEKVMKENAMEATRDVVIDLLPLYFSGEASADTQRLVEAHFAQDAEFGRTARAIAGRVGAAAAGPGSLDALKEKTALTRTRDKLRHRNQLLGFAIAYTLMPLSFMVYDGHVRWIMLRDNPKMAMMFMVAGLGCWLAYAILGRRVRQSGL
jgi:hypothetical protein